MYVLVTSITPRVEGAGEEGEEEGEGEGLHQSLQERDIAGQQYCKILRHVKNFHYNFYHGTVMVKITCTSRGGFTSYHDIQAHVTHE